MGIDNYYRALPADDELVRLAQNDKDIAEDVLFSVLLFEVPSFSIPLVERYPHVKLARNLVERYPNLRDWHFYAGRWDPYRFAKDLYYGTAGAVYANWRDPLFESSLALKFTQGDCVFNEQFTSTTGFPIRVSSPKVVREIADYTRSVDISS